MGGKSSSSNTTTQETSTIDNKQTADNGAVIARAQGGDVVINQTMDEAVQISEKALSVVDKAVAANGDTYSEALKFAEGTLGATYDLQMNALNEVSATSTRALDVVAQGFDQALQESREDSTQLYSQLITFGIPAVIVFLIWKG